MRVQRLAQFLLLAALVLGLSPSVPAQEQQIMRKGVPAAVLAAFTEAYPNATIKGYSKETENGQVLYEIESEEGKTVRDVTYSAAGQLISVEETLEVGELPSAVKAALDKNYLGGKIQKAEKITKGTVVTYEFKIKHNGKKMEIVFDPEGNELKK